MTAVTLKALNAEGRVFVELLGDLREDGATRYHLGFEIVDVFKHSTPAYHDTLSWATWCCPPTSSPIRWATWCCPPRTRCCTRNRCCTSVRRSLPTRPAGLGEARSVTTRCERQRTSTTTRSTGWRRGWRAYSGPRGTCAISSSGRKTRPVTATMCGPRSTDWPHGGIHRGQAAAG